MRLIPQAVEHWAETNPAAEAVRFGGKSLNYGELATEMNRAANLLLKLGLQKGGRVGIFMNKRLETPAVMHGIMRAGGAYVPIDPSTPRDRLAFLIKDCEIRHLFTQPNKQADIEAIAGASGLPLEHAIGLEAPAAGVQCVGWEEAKAFGDISPPRDSPGEDDLAYIIYTSGSTGEPKGIMHTHASGLSFAKHAADHYGLSPGDRVGNHSPLHFDISIFDFFAAAVGGAAVVVIPEAAMILPASYAALMESDRISVWFVVPFAIIQLLLRGGIESRDLAALRWIIYGGEPIAPEYVRRWMEAAPNAKVSNMYGPAETNGCTSYELESPPAGEDPIPIGKAFSNMKVIIEEGTGELLVSGPTVMRGYWNRPELNQAALVEMGGKRYYRTGDIVRRNPDGDFIFAGRKDRQVKVRGYRIELDEIEAALLSHQAVEEAAAYALSGGEGSKSIEAAVTLKPGAEADEAELLVALRGRLPRHAVPGRVRQIDQFPRTATGKVDRRKLEGIAAEEAGQP